MSGTIPDLTVVLTTAASFDNLWRTLAAVASQTIAERIEVLILVPRDDVSERAAPLLARFHSWRVIECGPIDNVDHSAAKGLLMAAAPVCASIEDHAFPDPEWGARILEAFEHDCVAAGSCMENANPKAGLSWSNMLIAYGQWSPTTPAGPTEWVALHNGTYRRAALEPYGEELWQLFNRESEILVKLRDGGGAFRFVPGARIRHLNPSSLGSTAKLRFDAGRLYAANRARDEGWSLVKRIAYVGLGPVIPLLRYVRMRKELLGGDTGRSEAKLGPFLLLGLIFDAAGQMAGFAVGPGGARGRLAVFEMDRLDHLNPSDRGVFASVP